MKNKKDDDMLDATRYLMKSFEVSMYGPTWTKEAWALKELLSKLGIKSARNAGFAFGGALQIESLEVTLKNATFNFGKPDSLMMDPKHFAAFKKAAKK